MKHVIASLTIGACLLLPSAGLVLAADPHSSNPSTVSGPGKGQPGSSAGVSCTVSANALQVPGGSGTASNPSGTNGSPFNQAIAKTYAGNPGSPTTAPGSPASSRAVSQYDGACLQVSTAVP